MTRRIDPTTPREDANHCFVCGPGNASGLKVAFHMDGEVCRADFTPGPDHVGWEDTIHGGILFALLDDVMANWLYLQDLRGHTARCEIRYRQPLRVGTPVRLEGRLVERRGRMATMAGCIDREDGQRVAEAEARFMLVP